MSTYVRTDLLINLVRARIFELQKKLINTKAQRDRLSITTAIHNNNGWLIRLGEQAIEVEY